MIFFLRIPIPSPPVVNRLFSSSTICYDNRSFKWNQLLTDESKVKCIERFNQQPQIRMVKRDPKRFAAVLIPIVETSNSVSLLYTLRSSKLSSHIRQVSFPGGGKDESDKTMIDCALRETEEEIGIPKENVEVWGIGKTMITIMDPAIIPVIGFIRDYKPNLLKLNPDEVEKVFTVPIEFLSSKRSMRHTQYRNSYNLPVYIGGEEKIWGITAVITHQFLSSFLSIDEYNNPLTTVANYRTIVTTTSS